MYFWAIQRLRNDLASATLSETAAFWSFFLVLLLQVGTFLLTASRSQTGVWENFELWFGVFCVLVGTLWAFISNGGGRGRDFLRRYFSLVWVLSVRFAAILIPIGVVWALYSGTRGVPLETFRPYEAVAFAALQLLFYWRLSVHMTSVAKLQSSAGLGATSGAV